MLRRVPGRTHEAFSLRHLAANLVLYPRLQFDPIHGAVDVLDVHLLEQRVLRHLAVEVLHRADGVRFPVTGPAVLVLAHALGGRILGEVVVGGVEELIGDVGGKRPCGLLLEFRQPFGVRVGEVLLLGEALHLRLFALGQGAVAPVPPAEGELPREHAAGRLAACHVAGSGAGFVERRRAGSHALGEEAHHLVADVHADGESERGHDDGLPDAHDGVAEEQVPLGRVAALKEARRVTGLVDGERPRVDDAAPVHLEVPGDVLAQLAGEYRLVRAEGVEHLPSVFELAALGLGAVLLALQRVDGLLGAGHLVEVAVGFLDRRLEALLVGLGLDALFEFALVAGRSP